MDEKNNSGLLLPFQNVASILGVGETEVSELVKMGMLAEVNLTGNRYIPKPSLETMINGFSNSGEVEHGHQEESALYFSHSDEGEEISVSINGKVYKGKVYPLNDGRFLVSIPKGKKPDGSRDREQVYFRDKAQADEYLVKRLVELNSPAVSSPPAFMPMGYQSAIPTYDMFLKSSNLYQITETFEEYAMRVLNMGVGKAKPRTIECYRTGLVPVIKGIGRMKFAEIDKEVLKRLFNELAARYSKSSLNKSFLGTKAVFDEVYDKELFLKNPFDTLKCPESKVEENEERKPYSEEELDKLFSCAKDYTINKMVFPMLAIYECSGMRPGELRALEWKNYNCEEGSVYIRNAIVKEYDKITDMRKRPKEYEVVGKTKTPYSVRKILLSDIAIAALDEWRAELNKMPSAMRRSKFIFPSDTGDFKSESSVRDILRRFIKKYDLKSIEFMQYRFRHTVCTRLLTNGVDMPVVKRILGDNSSKMVEEVYYHLAEEKLLNDYSAYTREQDKRYIEKYKQLYA